MIKLFISPLTPFSRFSIIYKLDLYLFFLFFSFFLFSHRLRNILNFPFPSLIYFLFYFRLFCITERLEFISNCSTLKIIEMVGDAYRIHYKQKCRGVSWYHQLHSLQLIAVCLGKEMKINENFGSSSAINSFLRLVMFLFFVNLIFI